MDTDQEQDSVIEEDYYTFLNLPRNATTDEIHHAYRRQCRLYHPDKHVDPVLKKKAENLFNRTNKAYEVLSDPHQRAVYDILGIKGLEVQEWEIIPRTKTPQEIREEYERIAREHEEIRLRRRTNPKGNITVNINATNMFNKYDEEYDESVELLGGVEISGMTFEQSIQAPLTARDVLTLYGQLDTANGRGMGTIHVAAKRTLSNKSWVEVDIGAGNGPSLKLEGYQALTQRLYSRGLIEVKFDADKVRPCLGGSLGYYLDGQTTGFINYEYGLRNGMTTTIMRETQTYYTALNIHFGFFNTFVSFIYFYNMPEKRLKLKGKIKVGTLGAHLEYGLTKKVSEQTALSASVQVGVPDGISLRIRVARSSQTYLFPIHLSEQIAPAPLFYATVAPLITWTIIKKLIVDPITKERREREKQKQKELYKMQLLEKQREAKAAIDLMEVTFSRIRAEEEAKGGLVITKALYGRFVYPDRNNSQYDIGNDPKEEVIDVTVPLQCLVTNSRLVLHEGSKSELPGFYDPCYGEDKQLLLQYLFRRQIHECLIKDNEPLRIPIQSHRVNPT